MDRISRNFRLTIPAIEALDNYADVTGDKKDIIVSKAILKYTKRSASATRTNQGD
jgi:hypothetical protein